MVSFSSTDAHDFMRVLQVNARLQEGGAARIALDLHRQLKNYGVQSRFAYGWGEKGGKSSAESDVPHSFQVGQQLQVMANMASHAVFGLDYIPPFGKGRQLFIQSVEWADIIHLHVVHSYFLSFDWLVKVLIQYGKPVIYTAHDYWILTGRCASAEGCINWKVGCGHCPAQKNYPSSYFDLSAWQLKTKRYMVAELGQLLHIVTPSDFHAQVVKEGLPEVDVCTINNWIDKEFEEAVRKIPLSDTQIIFNQRVLRVLVIANDLSDPTKVDRELVIQLMKLSHIEIHTVGLNSPFEGARVVNHGRISVRDHMVNVMASAHIAIFSSQKDTFGLVMIEALSCGVPVYAVESLAANEVLGKLGLNPISGVVEILNLLERAELPGSYVGKSRKRLRDEVLAHYSGSVGIARYIHAYKKASLCI